MDDIFERMLSTKLVGQVEVHWDFNAFRSAISNLSPS